MKKMICLLTALLLCVMVVSPAYAAEEFVPSISYKDEPEMDEAEMNGEDVLDCLVVTSIQEALEGTTDIPEDALELLLQVYEELLSGEMELPVDEDGYVILDLADVSWLPDCTEEHDHEEWLENFGTTLDITFDLGIAIEDEVLVFVFVDGEWVEVETINNGDGTVTCIFEEICPVAFTVREGEEVAPPPTGDLAIGQLMLWGGLMAVSALTLVFVLVMRRKESQA